MFVVGEFAGWSPHLLKLGITQLNRFDIGKSEAIVLARDIIVELLLSDDCLYSLFTFS